MNIEKLLLKIVVNYNLDGENKSVISKLEDLRDYLISKNIEDYSRIYLSVVESFIPTASNSFPWIPEFKTAINPSSSDEREAIEAFEIILRKINVYCPLVLESPYAQAGLDAIGGWLELGNSDPEQMNWTRKGFVKAYIGAKKDGYISPPKIYRGLADIPARLIMIGDQVKCRIAYDEQNSGNKALDYLAIKQIENKSEVGNVNS
jgi:hypothetical protein